MQETMPNGSSADRGPTSIIIFGASGDLTQLKMIPALYTLAVEGRLPEHYSIIGVARSAFDDGAFREHLRRGVEENARLAKTDEEAWALFSQHLWYCQGYYG